MPAWVDGALSARRRAALERHVATCDACRAEAARTRRLLDALGTWTTPAALPAGLEAATLARMQAALGEASAPSGRRTGWWARAGLVVAPLAAAAVIVLAVGLARRPDAPDAPMPRVAATRPTPRAAAPAAVATAKAPPAAARPAAAPDAAHGAPAALPPELAQRPDLFVELPMLRQLEKLQHYEAIETTTLGDDAAPPSTEPQSNG